MHTDEKLTKWVSSWGFENWYMKGRSSDILLSVLDIEAEIENTDFKISVENALCQIASYQHETQNSLFFFF